MSEGHCKSVFHGASIGAYMFGLVTRVDREIGVFFCIDTCIVGRSSTGRREGFRPPVLN